jgi:pimeloyl-ACP methyl ester carboxylesterase
VTGRNTYERFRLGIDMLALEGATRQRIDAQVLPLVPATDAEIQMAMDRALDRAYAVAWALRGPATQRAALRARLGWIAVSGEDDTPHRPVNVPAPAQEQFEVTVRTTLRNGLELNLRTRYVVATADSAQAGAVPVANRVAPSDPIPNIPPDHAVLLFLHGHSSGADEALSFIPHLIQKALERNIKLAVVAFDLPNNGYSETFDHARIAGDDATTFPFWATDNDPIATPILDFIEDFIVAFVDALEDVTVLNGTPRIKNRIAGVIGGSLGGNLGLRLGRRSPKPDWLRAIVAWSPASVWTAMVKNDPRHEGPRNARDRYKQLETDGSRREYFATVYDNPEKFLVFKILDPQPQFWYREGFPQKDALVAESRLARREIYNRYYRMWHWRVACEQLIYSHLENEVYGDSTTPVRCTLNTVRMLLAAGSIDSYPFTNIYDYTQQVARKMTRCPGRLLLVLETGHSIHFERPAFFAGEIARFLAARSREIRCVTRQAGRIARVGGFDHTGQATFDITQQQCIADISNGDEFFVSDCAGNLAAVIVAQTQGDPGPLGTTRHYIKTEADGVEPNNLASLPACP